MQAGNNASLSEKKVEEPKPTVNYTCEKCEFTSTSKWELTRHILRIHKEMKYPCDYCDYKASQSHRLPDHMRKEHNK